MAWFSSFVARPGGARERRVRMYSSYAWGRERWRASVGGWAIVGERGGEEEVE